MPDTIERTIYKLELDDSGYIKGIDSLAASTKRFAETQKAANDTLKTNEAALKANSERLEKARKDLENYSGTNARYRKQLENDVKSAQKDQTQLTELVNKNRVAYESATKAAQDFANVTARAGNTNTRVATPVPQSIAPIQNILGGVEGLDVIVSSITNEFEALRIVIALVEKEMEGLNEESEEFKQLAPIVEQGKNTLSKYDEVAKKSTGSTQSLRTQLRLGREELVKLEGAGKGATKEYIDLEKRVAKLTDAFGDQQQRIKILASDTKLLDFGKGAITAATSAFQAYTSVAILVGDENEELQKKTMQLFAAMQLLQSIEQLSNLTRREGILSTLGLTGAQSAYAAVVGATTGALKAFRIALAVSGIGVAVAAIGFLVSRYQELAEATKEAAFEQDSYKKISLQSVDAVAKVKVEINELQTRIKLAKEGFLDKNVVLKEYNEGLGKTLGATNDLNEAEQTLIDNAPALIQYTFLKAQAQAAGELALVEIKKATEAQFKELNEFATTGEKVGAIIKNVFRTPAEAAAAAAKKAEENRVKERKQSEDHANKLLKIQSDLQRKAAEFAKTNGLITDPEKPDSTARKAQEIQNEFLKERSALNEKLSALDRQQGETELKIQQEFSDKLLAERLRIERLVRDRKLKAGSIDDETSQAGQLFAISQNINDKELQKALDDFRKKVTDTREKLNNDLNALQLKNTQDNLNLIQDDFDRRARLINFNQEKETAQAKEDTKKRLADVDLSRLLIGEEEYQKARAKIILEGEIAILNIIEGKANERQDLSADVFQKSIQNLEAVLDENLLQLDEATTIKILEQKELLKSGVIDYEQFQTAITRIQKEQKEERDRIRLEELNAELRSINTRLAAVTDAEEKESLQKQQRSVRKQISDINSGIDKQDETDNKKVETLEQYVQSIGTLAEGVVSFWQKANEAESAALDRSIALQEKRVEAARRIAERGNAEYLRQEEDRLKAQQVLKENAARRELGINAALQASQLLVGITGAISKIATPGIGIAETIGAIGVIFGALATGYGLVRSLQGSQPKLFKGTTYLKRDGHPAGRDTIPAMLNEGEAVIPTDKNKEYHPTIKAVYDGTIPPEDLNNFVKNYHKIKTVPQPNYQRIKESAELKINQDGKMAVALSEQNKLIRENNDLQRQTIRALKGMGVNVNMDKNGIAVSVMEVVEQIQKDKRA